MPLLGKLMCTGLFENNTAHATITLAKQKQKQEGEFCRASPWVPALTVLKVHSLSDPYAVANGTTAKVSSFF